MLYPKDPSITVERENDGLEFFWRRPLAEGIISSVVGIFMLLICIPISITPYKDGRPRETSDILFIWIFFGTFALIFLYAGVSALVNRMRIRADRSKVRYSAGPIPWSRSLEMPAQRLKQFFAVSSMMRGNHGSYSYNTIYVMDSDDHVRALAKGMPSAFAANQICHELEDYYGIEDMPVYGVTTDPSHPGPRAK